MSTSPEARCTITELYVSQCSHCRGVSEPRPSAPRPAATPRAVYGDAPVSLEVPVGRKECRRCHKVKKIDDFYVDDRMADRRKSWCKPCHTANTTDAQRRRRERNRKTS